MKHVLLNVIAIASLGMASAAHASSTLYDSIGTDVFNTLATSWDVKNLPSDQAFYAVSFNTGAVTTVTTVTAFLSKAFNTSTNGPSATIGLMTTASGTPSGSFLGGASVEVSPTTGDVELTGLNWAVSTDTVYWLAVVAASGSELGWQWTSGFDTGTLGSYDNISAIWSTDTAGFLPDAFVAGTAPAVDSGVPEPASMVLLGMGLVGIAAARRHRR